MGEQELVFDLSELKLTSYTCIHCRTTVVFDASQTDQGVPEGCPAWNRTPACAEVKSVLDTYRNLYQQIGTLQKDFKFQFRVRVPCASR